MKKRKTLFDALSNFSENDLDNIDFKITRRILQESGDVEDIEGIIAELMFKGVMNDLEAKDLCQKLKSESRDFLI